jgi:hypothetical protein
MMGEANRKLRLLQSRRLTKASSLLGEPSSFPHNFP